MKKLFLSIALMFLCVFGLFACGEPSAELQAAADFLDGLYLKNGEVQKTPDDYTVVNKTVGNGVAFDITWSIEIISGNKEDVTVLKGDTSTTIVINETSEVEAKYYLVAVISQGNDSIEKKYEKVKEAYQAMTWEDVEAAEEGAVINAKGVITGIVGTDKLNIYFENEQGGYYIYSYTPTDENKSKIVVGATIDVSGVKDVYNGLVEFTSSTVKVLDEELKTVTPKDITAVVTAAPNNKDASLTKLVSQYVTIKGVEMIDITDKYLNFKLGDVASYVYISSSSNMVTADEIVALKDKVVKGRTATITGMVALYSGQFYIIPNTVDSITLDALPELSDAEKVADAKAKALDLAAEKVVSNLKLFTTTDYEGVTVAWVSSNEELIKADGTLVASPAEDTEVKLTATITAGAVTETVEVTVTVAAVKKMSIAEVNTLFGEEKVVYIEGKVVATYNKGKGSFIADETGVVYLYTKLPEGIALGDSVKLIAKTTVWENSGKEYTRQLNTISIEKLSKEVKVLGATKANLSELVDKYGSDTTGYIMTADEKAAAISSKYYGKLYEFTGYVVEHKFGTYTNYGLSLTEDGATFVLYQYQNDLQEEFKALLGKKVTIVAPMYGYSAQYGWRIGTYLTAVEATAETNTLPTAKNSVAEVKLAAKDTEIEVIGQVCGINEGNGFYVMDTTGAVYVYGKDAVATVKVGDIVKVTGKAGFYKGPQIASPVVEKISEGTFAGQPEVLTVEEFLALDPSDLTTFGKFITVKGTPVASGDYVNLKVAENKTANMYLSAELKTALGALAGKNVEVTAFLYQQSGSYPFNLVVTSYKEVAE